MKTYVIDIDGTICNNTFGDYESATPFEDRIAHLNKLYDEGNTIIYLTARGMGRYKNSRMLAHQNFFDLTYNQLQSWGCKFHELHLGKPAGDVYVDDKGVFSDEFFVHEK
jgi:ribonucleotide monophosphatase NagD (HAD superfamily)